MKTQMILKDQKDWKSFCSVANKSFGLTFHQKLAAPSQDMERYLIALQH
jgi:hypothetical protein